MTILKMEGAMMFNFLLSEANDWRSRDQIEVDNSDGEEPLLAGSLLAAGATSADPAVAWASGASIGILGQTVAAGETGRRTVITRDAEVRGPGLVVPDASTLALVSAALLARGIVVRTNEGLKIEPAVSIA